MLNRNDEPFDHLIDQLCTIANSIYNPAPKVKKHQFYVVENPVVFSNATYPNRKLLQKGDVLRCDGRGNGGHPVFSKMSYHVGIMLETAKIETNFRARQRSDKIGLRAISYSDACDIVYPIAKRPRDFMI